MRKLLILLIISIFTVSTTYADDYSADANQMAREYLEHKRKMELLKRAQEEAKLKQQIASQYKQCISTGVAVEECDALIANIGSTSSSVHVNSQSEDNSYFKRTDSNSDYDSESGEGSASMQLLKKLQNDVEDMKSKKGRSSASPVKSSRTANVRVPKMIRVVNGKVIFKTAQGEVSARAGDTLPGGFVLKSFSLTRAMLSLDGKRYESEISW